MLRHPGKFQSSGIPFNSYAAEYAFITAVKLGNKDNRRLLEPFLEYKCELRDCIDRHQVDTPPQTRDLALSTIVQLSGARPEDYGFVRFAAQTYYWQPPAQVFLFRSTKERNRPLSQCAKNYKELGLRTPPRFSRDLMFSPLPRVYPCQRSHHPQRQSPLHIYPDGTVD